MILFLGSSAIIHDTFQVHTSDFGVPVLAGNPRPAAGNKAAPGRMGKHTVTLL